MIAFLRRFLCARKLTAAEREFLDAASRYCHARAEHRRSQGWSNELLAAWSKLNAARREARQLGLPLAQGPKEASAA